MEHLEAYNRKLLANILPVHVAEHFLNTEKNNDVSWFCILYVPEMHYNFRYCAREYNVI